MQQLKDLGLTQFNFDCLMACVDSNEDVDEFLDYYWRGQKDQFFSIADYRKHKINNDNITFEEFEKMFKKDKKKALEKLFRHEIYDWYIEIIDEKIAKYGLYRLYEFHIKSPFVYMTDFFWE